MPVNFAIFSAYFVASFVVYHICRVDGLIIGESLYFQNRLTNCDDIFFLQNFFCIFWVACALSVSQRTCTVSRASAFGPLSFFYDEVAVAHAKPTSRCGLDSSFAASTNDNSGASINVCRSSTDSTAPPSLRRIDLMSDPCCFA